MSYVREDSCHIDRICERLAECNTAYWLDRRDILPGRNWKRAVESAIEEGGLFVACFSDRYLARERTHMNEELWLAISELRLRGFGHEWFIPVRFTDCELPEIRISACLKLGDVRTIDFFDDFAIGLNLLMQYIIEKTGCTHVWIKTNEKLIRSRDISSEPIGVFDEMFGTREITNVDTYEFTFQCDLCKATKVESKDNICRYKVNSDYKWKW